MSGISLSPKWEGAAGKKSLREILADSPKLIALNSILPESVILHSQESLLCETSFSISSAHDTKVSDDLVLSQEDCLGNLSGIRMGGSFASGSLIPGNAASSLPPTSIEPTGHIWVETI